RRQNHARRAVAALQAVLLPERLLQSMESVAPGQPLDRGDLGALGLHRKQRAGLHTATVEQHCAASALARIAADLRARQAHRVAQEVDQQDTRLDLARDGAAVDGNADGYLHRTLL